MVSAYTKGRFGNSTWIQMVAWVYAKKNGLSYTAPRATIAPAVWPTYHGHLIVDGFVEPKNHIGVNDWGHTYRDLPFDESWRPSLIMVGEKGVESGYFQSYIYLSGYEDQLRYAFKMTGKTVHGSVGIHWRMGDYKNFPDKHPVATDEYMRSAIHMVWNLARSVSNFVFFSDEIDQCKLFVDKYFKNVESMFSFDDGDVESAFKRMMHCEHQIVSNSSLSVLAAILNPNRRRIVVCPDESCYFGPGNAHLDSSTIMPEDWIRIKY